MEEEKIEILVFAQRVRVLERNRERLALELRQRCLIGDEKPLQEAYSNLETAFEECIVAEVKNLVSVAINIDMLNLRWAEQEGQGFRQTATENTVIPKFTRDEFLSTDKPYRHVAENVKDQLQKEKIIQLVCENAKEVGIQNFRKMYDCYSKLYIGEPSSFE